MLLPGWGASAQERLFDVIPPDKVAFNYPDPPREGSPDYLTIAESGQAQCVIVHPAESRGAAQAARALSTYLKLATGARFAGPIRCLPACPPSTSPSSADTTPAASSLVD